MKIWLPSIQAGTGSDVFVHRLAHALSHLGHDPVVQWFPRRYELMPRLLRSIAAPEGIDIVHAGSWQGFAFKRSGIPLVVTEHNYIDDPAFLPYKTFAQSLYHRYVIGPGLRASYHEADALTTVSEHSARAMRSHLNRPVTVVHNWVDVEDFHPRQAVAGTGDGSGQVKMLFVGNPSLRKGADLLPALATRLGSAFQIQCLGGLRDTFGANTHQGLRTLARSSQADMPEIYRSVDVVLVPTRYEAFGYVALEAMASGLPVLGFDSTGTAEICVHEETALLAPLNDLDQIIVYAKRLADPALRVRLGTAGRIRALDRFRESTLIDAYVDIYHRLLDGRSRA